MNNKNEGMALNPGDFEKIHLEHKGITDADKTKGDPAVLERQLQSIYAGKYIDSNLKIGLTEEERANYQSSIDSLKNSNSILDGDIKFIDESIAENQKRIKEYTNKINDIRAGKDSGHNPLDLFHPAKFFMILIVLLPLTAYLYLFYISAGLKGFYGNLDKLAEMMSEGLSAGGALPEPSEVAEAFRANWLLILIPFVPYAGGLGIHLMLEIEKKIKYLYASLLALVIFSFDFYIAMKIFSYTSQAKVLMGMETDKWYENSDFRIVLIMGFVVFIIWSILFDAAFKEWKKRNITGRLDDEIRRFNKKIDADKAKRNKATSLQSKNTNEITSLQNRLNTVYVFISDLEHNISKYFTGWKSFLENAGTAYDEKKAIADRIIKDYEKPRFKNGKFVR